MRYNGTSERFEDSAEPHARGIADQRGRLLVLITHNTDFGDSWEREGDDPTYFYEFSVEGYAFGINTLLYRDGTLNESQLGPPSLECHETPWVVHRPRHSRRIGDICGAGVPAARNSRGGVGAGVPAARRRAHAP